MRARSSANMLRSARLMRAAWFTLATWAASTSLPGCATVAPYERERLARRDMELDRNPELGAGQQHATAYREGSSGAEGASGGGCGCN